MNPIQKLHTEQDQSVWQDDISRALLANGALKQAIDTGIRGVTSNPSIFQKAIAGSDAYDEDIQAQLGEGKSAAEIFQTVAVKDIQDTCDLFRPVYDESNGTDGFVSIEVLPSLARDTEGTLENARTLWNAVNRSNVMIKVPGTEEGVPAIRTLLSEGININVTLLFSLANYERVALAFIEALEERQAKGEAVSGIASVASFFVSRVDTLADKQLDGVIAEGGEHADLAASLKGKVAVANAQLAYEKFLDLFKGDRFAPLAAAGAQVQRPLWASTGTKNKAYSDVLYVETLIGPETVNTAPIATIEAFLDHGVVARTVDADLAGAHAVLEDLAKVGLSIDQITAQLEDEGITTFITSYDGLLADVEAKRTALAGASAE
ncbi:MAG: transaldolase [Thermomicrobiales bacterium]